MMFRGIRYIVALLVAAVVVIGVMKFAGVSTSDLERFFHFGFGNAFKLLWLLKDSAGSSPF